MTLYEDLVPICMGMKTSQSTISLCRKFRMDQTLHNENIRKEQYIKIIFVSPPSGLFLFIVSNINKHFIFCISF